jgi:acetylornithine deacetylase/succinyl-diaminopimelate desuccinylase-like protein
MPVAQKTLNLLEFLRKVAQTPAPSFLETPRAALIAQTWASFGLVSHTDEVGNVIAKVAGKGKSRVALCAHLDTVFELGTDLTVHQHGNRLVGAGIGDNAASLTVLTAYAERLARDGAPCEVWLVASTCEEGLGDLRGAKHFLKNHSQELDGFIAVDGYIGLIVNQAVGVRRYRAKFQAEGGHSWGNAGAPSSIHGLAEAVHELYKLPLSNDPRTTLSVGTISGGTSINSIAATSEMLLDLRSLDSGALEQLDLQARAAMLRGAKRAKVELNLEQVGNRSAGKTDTAQLTSTAMRVLEHLGIAARAVASSTDANAAVPYNIPAIGFGVYKGGNAHRLDEWVDPSSLELGLKALEAFVKQIAR